MANQLSSDHKHTPRMLCQTYLKLERDAVVLLDLLVEAVLGIVGQFEGQLHATDRRHQKAANEQRTKHRSTMHFAVDFDSLRSGATTVVRDAGGSVRACVSTQEDQPRHGNCACADVFGFRMSV